MLNNMTIPPSVSEAGGRYYRRERSGLSKKLSPGRWSNWISYIFFWMHSLLSRGGTFFRTRMSLFQSPFSLKIVGNTVTNLGVPCL